jgi:hypothetical protein
MFGGARETWPPDTEVVEIGWEDNPWFPEVLRKSKDHAYATDPESAEHIWGGKLNVRSDAQSSAASTLSAPLSPKRIGVAQTSGKTSDSALTLLLQPRAGTTRYNNEYLIEYAVFRLWRQE